MKTAPSEAFEGAAEEIVEVDIDEEEIVGYLDAPIKIPIQLQHQIQSQLQLKLP